MKYLGLNELKNNLVHYLTLYGSLASQPVEKPPLLKKTYQVGAALSHLPQGVAANGQTAQDTFAGDGIFETRTGGAEGDDFPDEDIHTHVIHQRAVQSMSAAQQGTVDFTTQDVLKKYFQLATNFGKNQKIVWDKDYDIFLKDVYTGRAASGADPQEVAKLRKATRDAMELAQNWIGTRDTLIRQHAHLTPYIDRCIFDARDRAIIPISEGQPLDPYLVTPDGLLRQAQAMKLAAERAQFDVEVKSVYEPHKAGYIRGADMQRGHEVFSLKRGSLVFKGPRALRTALEFAPRAHHVSIGSGIVPISTTHFGPLTIRNDKYSPKEIKYEDPHFSPGALSLEEDRYKSLMIYDDEYSLDNGETWQANPFRTSPEQETAKYNGARELIKTAAERMSSFSG